MQKNWYTQGRPTDSPVTQSVFRLFHLFTQSCKTVLNAGWSQLRIWRNMFLTNGFGETQFNTSFIMEQRSVLIYLRDCLHVLKDKVSALYQSNDFFLLQIEKPLWIERIEFKTQPIQYAYFNGIQNPVRQQGFSKRDYDIASNDDSKHFPVSLSFLYTPSHIILLHH